MRHQPFLGLILLLTFAAVLLLLPGNIWAQGNFVYTNNNLPLNTVSGFSVSSNGTLNVVPGSPFATGGTGSVTGFIASNRIVVDNVGNLLFASNSASNDVSVFSINPGTGTLSLVAGSPFSTEGTGDFPGLAGGIALSPTPDGKFLMAANSGSRNVTVFSIAGSGALTPIAGSPFPALGIPGGIKVSPDGKFLAVAEPFGSFFSEQFSILNQVEMFRIASNGSLTSLGASSGEGGRFLIGVDVDCSTSLLYGGEGDPTNIVDGYSIASNGTLTPVPGSPFVPGVGSSSDMVLLSSDDKTLFVSNIGSDTITAFSVDSGGSLSLVAGSPFPMHPPARFPVGMSINQDGSLLYVASPSYISVFNVASNGALTEVSGSPFLAGLYGGLESLTAFPPKACARIVGIEIKPPASPPVPVNSRARGIIPVAILSTPTFNAVAEISTSSLTFGHTGNESSLTFCGAGGEDVNGDGLIDLLCKFSTTRTGFVAGDTTALLKGQTVTGRKIQGSEDIKTVPE